MTTDFVILLGETMRNGRKFPAVHNLYISVLFCLVKQEFLEFLTGICLGSLLEM